MQYSEMSDIDIRLHLMSNHPFQLGGLEIRPHTLSEIRDYGYQYYMSNLQWLTVSVDDFIKSTDDLDKRVILQAERSKLRPFDFFIKLGDEQFKQILLYAISMIFRTRDVRIIDKMVVMDFVKMGIIQTTENGFDDINDDALEATPEEELKIINRDNFDDIVRIIKYQNYLSSANKGELNPANEEARKLAETMERNRKRVEEKKKVQQFNEKGEDAETDITDIISAVTAKSNSINKFNVWDLSLYQLYEEY